MILTTTPNIEGHIITQYLGIVTGGADLLLAGALTPASRRLPMTRECINTILSEIQAQANALGADAVVSISFFFKDAGYVIANGTAVKIIATK